LPPFSLASILTDQKDIEQVVVQKWFYLTPIDLFQFELDDIFRLVACIGFEVFLIWRDDIYCVWYLVDLIQLCLDIPKSLNGQKQNCCYTYQCYDFSLFHKLLPP
jgi:hypothetical protein